MNVALLLVLRSTNELSIKEIQLSATLFKCWSILTSQDLLVSFRKKFICKNLLQKNQEKLGAAEFSLGNAAGILPKLAQLPKAPEFLADNSACPMLVLQHVCM